MNKLAALNPSTWNTMKKAILNQKDINKAMIELGEHFKIDNGSKEALLQLKRTQYPKTKIVLIDKYDDILKPAFYPKLNTIATYDEPWSFMHEFGHAREKSDVFDKIRRALPINTIVTPKQQTLIDDYVSMAYNDGNKASKDVGNLIANSVEKSKSLRERDTWRMNEELRANARAFIDTKKLTGDSDAYKIMQPLSLSDVSYINEYYPEEVAKILGNYNKESLSHRVLNSGVFDKVREFINKINNGLPNR